MTKLVDALRTEDTLTENGMTTNSTSLNACVDLFSSAGAMRGQDKTRLIALFTKAFAEDTLTAMKILFWVRDIRGGAGERQVSRDIFNHLAQHKTEALRKNLHLMSEYGRWDDLLTLVGTKLESDALEILATALKGGNALCAKWMPRGNSGGRDKKRYAKALREFLKLDQKSYRKMLSELSNTVEQLMCAKKWKGVNYEHVPSKAMSDYMKAFTKNDTDRFQGYLGSLEKGEAKINTGAIYPYDVTKNMKHGESRGADAQWAALPNFMEGNTERLLPVVDTSGSMGSPAGGQDGNSNVSCMDVAISLGLYISERNEGIFKDAFVTFSSTPTLQYVNGGLTDRYNQMQRADWSMSTNIEATFKMLLDTAIKNELLDEDMPSMILILSDMEFNAATGAGGYYGRGEAWNPTAQTLITKMYKDAGYTVPKVVYWNIQSRGSNKPVQFNETDTALVSGFSPAILKNLLAGKDLTPYAMMMDVISSERYAPVTV